MRIYVENKPVEGIKGEVCVGSSPKDINRILQETQARGFVLDFGHAIYAANTLKIDPYDFIEKFLPLNPEIFHLSDGSSISTKDCHNNLGEGSFDLCKLISFIPFDVHVTLETPRDIDNNLKNFKNDLEFLRSVLTNRQVRI
jgi:sugar phosphate isomerase/epimerase